MQAHKETLKQISSQEEDDAVSCSSKPFQNNPIEIAGENSQKITMDGKIVWDEANVTLIYISKANQPCLL